MNIEATAVIIANAANQVIKVTAVLPFLAIRYLFAM